MGLFDTYVPDPPLRCPRCGRTLADWQGKDGPCALLTWEQGKRHPVSQNADDCGHPYLAQFTLPAEFEIYTFCSCGEDVTATGRAAEGVWDTLD